MKFLLLDVKNEKVEAIDIEPTLDEYYRVLDCDIIDIPTRYIGGRKFDIICDDEALLKDDTKISAINRNGGAMLGGNLLFCHHDNEGNTVGLEDEEIEFLKDKIHVLSTRLFSDGYPMLTRCEFFSNEELF